jgi:hypothetical protein
MRIVIAATFALVALGCGGGGNNNQDGGGSLCVEPSVEYTPTQSGGWQSVCMFGASVEATRTQCGEVTERCDKTGTAAPDLSCITTPTTDEPASPATVTLTGFATVFSAGPDSKKIRVEVYDATTVGSPEALAGATPIGTFTTDLPASGTPDDDAVRACPTEQVNKDEKIGCVSPASASCSPACQDSVTGAEFCYLKPGETSGKCVDRSRYEPRYTIPNVPTRTPLLVVTTGPGGLQDQTWRMLIQENEYISTNAPECSATIITNCFHDKAGAAPTFELNANALSRGDYASIAVAAGLPSGIPAGHGGIAGEVRDCGDVRVQNVEVGTYPAAAVLTYFNGNQWNTLPVRTRAEGTCRLGLYAALDLVPGKVQIEAAGLVGGQLTSFGWYDALVFPDAVTIVSLNTGKPLPATP